MKKQDKKRFPQVPRLPGEPENWYQRLIAYLLQGPSRSMLKVFLDEQPHKAPKGPVKWLPSGWKKRIEEFRWSERADEFDRQTSELEKEAYFALKDRERRRRQRTYQALRRFLDAALLAANPITIPPAALIAGIRALVAVDGADGISGPTANDDTPEAFVHSLKKAFGSIRPPGGGK